MLDRWPSLDKCWFYTEVNIIYDLSVENNEILSIKKQKILIPTPFSRYLSCSKTNCSCLHASYGKWLYVRPSVILPTLKLTAQLAMKTMTIKPWPFHHSKLRWAFKYFFWWQAWHRYQFYQRVYIQFILLHHWHIYPCWRAILWCTSRQWGLSC